MESRARILGHAIHPILIVFPLGLLLTSVYYDVVHLVTDNRMWARIAYWMIAAGVVTGLAAAIPGIIDWLVIPGGTRAKRVGVLHGLGNVVMLLLFGVSWLLRSDAPLEPGTFEIVLSFVGAGLALATGWLGGELVERLGVGVDDGAHLNAPSSLSGRPAREGVGETGRRAAR
jgi:uncharacterized membrane protein